MLLGFNGAAIALVAARRVPLCSSLPCCCARSRVSFAVERVIPYEAEWNRSHDDAERDVAHALVNETFALLSRAGPAGARRPVLGRRRLAAATFPFLVQVLATILVFDLGITLAHWPAIAGARSGASTPFTTRSSAPTASTG